MNKVFKVIWNEARNAYVVVSEIAKNHGSKSSSTKKLLAMLIATGVMTCASFDVLAEPVAETTAAQQYVALKAVDFTKGEPKWYDSDTWGGLGSYAKAEDEWEAQNAGQKSIDSYTYTLDKNKYWVRTGYVLTVDQNGGKYTTLSANKIRADVAYNGTGVPKDILQSVTSTVAKNGVVTHSGDSLQKVTAGSYAGVSNSGGTGVERGWNYIIKDFEDSGWKTKVDPENYADGYVDLKVDKNLPKGFKTTGSELNWDEVKQTYTYKGKAVDYRNMYVIDGNLGVFTNADGSDVYTGTVYGKHNEILMTVKDNGKFYSYWAASVTDPTATMETYPVSQYNNDLAVIDSNIKAVNKDIIKEVTLTKNNNSATIGLVRNGGKAVDGAITVTSGGGTGGKDTFVNISNAADPEGKTFATGSKVEAIVANGATTGLKINGEAYTIKSGSKVSVAQNAAKKTTTITVDGQDTTITDTDTKYTAGNGIAIDKDNKNAISVKLKEKENNLEVTTDGLALKKDLTVDSVKAGATTVNSTGVTIGTGDKGIVLSNSNVSMGGQQIHNVKAGAAESDAVNVSQLNKVSAAAGKHTTLVDGENTTVKAVGDGANGKQYKVNVDLSKYAKTKDVAVVYVDNNKEKSLHTTNSNAVGSNAIALGKGASALDNSVVIGNGAYTQEGSLLTGSGYSVALGNNAVTGTKSTSVGYQAIGGRVGTITVGYKSYNGAAYGTVIGTESKINYSEQKKANAAATIVGAQSEIIADNKPYSGVANGIFGSANKIQNSNGVTIQGSGNTVTNAYKDMSGYDFYLGGVSVKKDAGAVGVIGGMNTVSNQIYTNVIGFGNTIAGDAANISHDVFLAGSRNNLSKVSDSIVMGNDNTISEKSNVISFGHHNKIKANNAVAIGNGAGVSVEGGVALGVGSVASTDKGVLGYGAAEGETGIAWKATHGAVSVGGNGITRQITNVAAGTADTDAVNVAQLKKVSAAATAAKTEIKGGTNIANVDQTTADDGHMVYTVNANGTTVSGDSNVAVTAETKDNNVTNYAVKLNKDLQGIKSISNNTSKLVLREGWAGMQNGVGASVFMVGGLTTINGKVTVDELGKISGVAAGKVSADSTDAVNGSQLNDVKAEAGKHTTLSNGKNTTVEAAVKDGQTDYKVNVAGDLTDISSVANGGAKLALNGEVGYASIVNGKGASIYMQDGYTVINSKVAFDQNGKISGVAAGKVSADSTDAVNGSQLNDVKTEAGKHTKVVNGSNINVEEINDNGQKTYKVGLKNDILLGDITGKNVSISGTDGTIEATGNIMTNNRVIADKGAKLADVDVTGDTISNGNSSVKLDKEGTVTVNNKVTIDGTGKVSGVAKGEISDTSTDAVNGSQLNDTNKRVTKVENDVTNIKGDITTIKGDITNIKGDITTIKGDVTNLDNRVTEVEKTAGKHSSVSTEDSNLSISKGTNTAGGTDYKVSLNKDLQLNSVTTGGTVMNTNGVKVGKNVSLTKDGLTAGDTKVTNAGLSIGDKTYVSKEGLNANNQTITNVADGKVEKDSKDAVNGSQLYATNQAVINNAENISTLNRSLSNLDNRVNKVGAGAAALAALHPLDFDPDAKWDFAAGYGNYRGTNAAAVGAYYRPNEDTMFSVGGTFGNGENMVNAGVSFKLGSGSSHVSTSRVAMAKEIKELRGELEAMKSAMLDANAGKKIDTSKLQLFPDVPQNHWAYEYVTQLAGNGMIEGYPDGNFAGDRPMTRYEFAAILYRAMTKGAVLSDKILSEFSHELEYFTVDTVAKDKAGNPTIQRVRTVKANTNK